MFLVHGQWGNYLWVDPGDGGTVVVLCWLGGWGGVAEVDLDCCVALLFIGTRHFFFVVVVILLMISSRCIICNLMNLNTAY